MNSPVADMNDFLRPAPLLRAFGFDSRRAWPSVTHERGWYLLQQPGKISSIRGSKWAGYTASGRVPGRALLSYHEQRSG